MWSSFFYTVWDFLKFVFFTTIKYPPLFIDYEEEKEDLETDEDSDDEVKDSPVEINPLDKFFEKQQKRWDDPSYTSFLIEPVFYDKKAYDSLTLGELKDLSKRWKTRVMMISSPLVNNTNILMYYDPEKLGFAYHSDFVISSPALLNALAMKYCLDFRCRDFFVDETVWKSPLLPIHSIVEETEKKVKEDSASDEAFRQTLKEKSKLFIAKKDAVATRKSNDPILVSNRFIYKNKVSDFSFLQKYETEIIEKKETVKELVFGIKPSLDCLFEDVMGSSIEGMFENPSVPSLSQTKSDSGSEPVKKYSYKWFKNLRKSAN